MTTNFVPQDQDARVRIREALSETLFVEAGAGTGKTTSLVDRVISLVTTGITTLDRMAVITFTEAAASELRDKIRERLERAATDDDLTEEKRSRCHSGVEDLDRSSIQTLHSFAANLLHERPLEAGLPPSFDVVDPIAGDLAFDELWSAWLDAALDDTELGSLLSMAFSLGLSTNHLRDVAASFHDNYDQLMGADFQDVAMPSSSVITDLTAAAAELQRLCGFSKVQDSDRLFNHVQGVLHSIGRLSDTDPGSPSIYRTLADTLPLRPGNRGRQTDWEIDTVSGQNACAYLKGYLAELDTKITDELAQVRSSVIAPLLRSLQVLVLDYAKDRKLQGKAEFHDLLVWARDLLRDNLEVRDHFRASFTHVLIDEAQDTDPIQAEIAMFLVEQVSGSPPSHERPRTWEDIRPEPGKLFVVGDPKQSIYRFRRADVRQMTRLQEHLGGEPVRLVQNFRSHRPILDWVNHVFSQWMQQGHEQPEYIPLTHRWDMASDDSGRPRVWSLGGPVAESNVDRVRLLETRSIASLVPMIGNGSWQVLDKEWADSTGHARYRPATYSDVCILMPRRTALRELELALDVAGVPYRLEGASLIFDTQEVRDLMNCLRAIDDPADQVSVAAALRSPAFACTDVDLLAFAEAGGRFDYLSADEMPAGPVADGLRSLAAFHGDRLWTSTASLIDGFVRDRLLMQVALDHPRTREQWRRYRFMVEQARAFSAAGGSSLRGFLKWADRQAAEGARVTEVPVPEGDEEAVRVMTVHAAKGLEFPVVILTGLNTRRSSQSDSVLLNRDTGAVEVSTGASSTRFTTPEYDNLAAQEQAMEEDEYVRLLYVAATRARDHLVVSLYRTDRDSSSAAALIPSFIGDEDHLWEPTPEVPDAVQASGEIQRLTDEPNGYSVEDREQWIEERAQMLQRQGRPNSVAATRLAQIAKEESTSEEPWKRGRGGTSLGRAVHAVLQTIDLSTGADIEDTARAQSAAEGLPHRESEVAALAQVAVESDVVRRAVASGRLWREVPVAVPLDDGVLEGFIDLLFEEDGCLVIVDYKTDTLEAEETEDATARYRLLAGSYALHGNAGERSGVPVPSSSSGRDAQGYIGSRV